MHAKFRYEAESPQFTDVVQYSAWVELVDQLSKHTGAALPARASSLYIVTDRGLLAGASISRTEDSKDEMKPLLYSAPAAPVGVEVMNVTMSVYAANPVTGERGVFVGSQRFTPTDRPYYDAQQRLADMGVAVQPAWSKLYDFIIPYEDDGDPRRWGLSQTRPITYCQSYSCFQGIVAADILLETVNVACRRAMKDVVSLLKKPMYGFSGVKPENSVVFIVNSLSKLYPEDQGVLIGTSDEGSTSEGTSRTKASSSSSAIVSMVANATLARFPSWSAIRGSPDNLVMFAFNLDDGRNCTAFPTDSRELHTACTQVAMRVFGLDDNLEWLIVVALPAMAFTQKALQIRAAVDEKVSGQENAANSNFYKLVVIFLLVAIFMSLLSVVIGLLLAKAVSRPLKQLGKRMHRLEQLDTSLHTISSQRGRIVMQEIQEVNDGFQRLTSSIKAIARFVPETVVRNMLSGDKRKRGLHVDSKTVTIMFSDVKDFTGIAESLQPPDLILTLYMYLTEMTRIVELFEGVVSEILGDGLLVFWNTPTDVDDHPAKACAAILAQQQALVALNEHLANLSLPQLSIRLGLHTGKVLAGNIGSESKMKFGCIGDPINLASRLEGLAKYYGVSALISGATKSMLPAGEFAVRKLDLVQVKGKREPTWVYELMGGGAESPPLHLGDAGSSIRQLPVAAPERCRIARMYESALFAFHEARLADAATLAEAVLREEPEDVPASRLLERAKRVPGPHDPPWTPVLQMTEK